MLNFDKLASTRVAVDPYPHLVLKEAIMPQYAGELVHDFPRVDHPGSIPISDVQYGKAFTSLLQDLHSDRFRGAMQKLFDTALDNAPILTTVRGRMRKKDGRIHTDSANKLLTVLVYFNRNWENDGGYLRILRNGKNLEDYVAEIPPMFGTMVAFKVTDNCWHGHYPVVGERLSLQMNYLVDDKAYAHFQGIHKISSSLKKLFG